MSLAPIVLFVYNRPDHTRRTLEALMNNILADQSDLFIFADGPKDNISLSQKQQIADTRTILHEKQWCKNVIITESETNNGLSKSIIDGVTKIINKYGKIIVLEDDIITGKYFLQYMNDALQRYENNKNVWHITGWRYPIDTDNKNLSYFYPIMDCWSWATWADRWKHYTKDPKNLKKTFTKKMIRRFNADNCDKNNWLQVELNLSGDINTWAIFWYAVIFQNNGLCLGPTTSLVTNSGFDASGTNILMHDNRLSNSHSIDYQITNFPDKNEINQEEYNKNKNYLKRLKRNNPILIFFKTALCKTGLFRIAKAVMKK